MNIFGACTDIYIGRPTKITFHAEVVILKHTIGRPALRIEITFLGPWTVLEAAAVGVGVTMSRAGGDVVNPGNTSYPTTRNVSGNILCRCYIDVRVWTKSDGP